MDLGSGYFDPLANTSRRKELFVMLRSPVMWPAGLYMNGELAQDKLFKPVGIKRDEIDKRSFLKLSFANKGLDAINLGNILHHKSEKSKIPPYFRDQSVPIILYTYTTPIATKIFKYKKVLQDLKSKPPDCTCASSPFIYNPAGHITGDLNITNNSCVI
jgi:hypothetical protein